MPLVPGMAVIVIVGLLAFIRVSERMSVLVFRAMGCVIMAVADIVMVMVIVMVVCMPMVVAMRPPSVGPGLRLEGH